MVWVRALMRCGGAAVLAAGTAVAFACSAEETPTYHEDVAPLLAENCVGCHRAGSIAPFALTDYASVRARADSIARVTAAREMPPMPVNNDGECNKYSNARWLSDREIDLLGRWARAGAPEGDEEAPREAPRALPELESPDALIGMAAEYTPHASASHHDDYRCFVLPAPVSEDRFLTSFQVYPGDARVVHHVIVYQPWSEDEASAARSLDAAEEGDGYTCFGSALIGASPLALWAPGVGRMDMPAGTGVALAANRDLVMQVHYNTDNGAFPDRTSVGLAFAGEPVIPGEYWSVANTAMMLPPGRERVESSHTDAWDTPIDFRVHGALPHMHTLGRTLRVEAEASGESRCLVDVDRWDFHWQNAWWYREPLGLEDVTALSIRCGFDTRSRSETVTWGDSTTDEMCISYFYVTTQAAPTPPISCTNPENPLFGSCLQALLPGCYEPDVSEACSVSEEGVLTWPDGSKIVVSADRQELYGPGDEEPCISVQVLENSAVISKGDEELLYSADDEGLTITCADGSEVAASQFHLYEFSMCTGLACNP